MVAISELLILKFDRLFFTQWWGETEFRPASRVIPLMLLAIAE